MRAPKVKDQPAERRPGGASDADDALEGSKKGPEVLRVDELPGVEAL